MSTTYILLVFYLKYGTCTATEKLHVCVTITLELKMSKTQLTLFLLNCFNKNCTIFRPASNEEKYLKDVGNTSS